MVSNRSSLDLKARLRDCLAQFGVLSPSQAAREFWEVLGYGTDLSLELTAPEKLLEVLDHRKPRRERLLIQDWRSLDGVFQIGEGQIRGQKDLFQAFDWHYLRSYIFVAVSLSGSSYGRSELAQFMREVNRLSDIPVLVLFRYGNFLTLAVIHRRPNLRDQSRDVLEKISLIKDINLHQPHRAHLEILAEFAAPSLVANYGIRNFDDLHGAWLKVLDISVLNRRFFGELSAWYFDACQRAVFPKDAGGNQESLIRLITRLLFVWFLKEKGLVPGALFEETEVRGILKSLEPGESSYYQAILQNLFFATLNTEGKREFIRRSGSRSHQYMVHNVFRYESYFQAPETVIERYFAAIPFLNGGLFECLDAAPEKGKPETVKRVDGFSDHPENPLSVPNDLFFGALHETDLNEAFGTKSKKYQVRGLLEILKSYKFTVTENTPLEEDVALDPELLGQVFENLLAVYNPDTQTTARKQTGSFYTPREIVNYMVDEALLAYLSNALADVEDEELAAKLRRLLALDEDNPFGEDEALQGRLIQAIDQCKILDPACGSGAFPMGVLHKMVRLLGKLDPHNLKWKRRQLDRIDDLKRNAEEIEDEKTRSDTVQGLEAQKENLERAFARNELDYGRKLFLIQNCIYGVDIQAIAVQITKLRFFIALIIDQREDAQEPNRGILPLPNLETKFVAANTLIEVAKIKQLSLFESQEIQDKQKKLERLRRDHFFAKSLKTKRKKREEDELLCQEITAILRGHGEQAVEKLQSWRPYDQNASASFFDPEWMFGVTEGFDIVIGNPPYVRQEKIKEFKAVFQAQYRTYTKTADLYICFYEKGLVLLKNKGTLAYISSNKWFRANYGVLLRNYIAENASIKNIVDFGELSVFSAATFPMIFIASKESTKKQTPKFTQVKSLEPPYPNIQKLIEEFGQDLPDTAIKGSDWLLTANSIGTILKKMDQDNMPLRNYVENQIFRGLLTGFNKAFVINTQKRNELIQQDPKSAEIIKPLAVGDNVRKWHIRESSKYLILTKIGVPIKNYSAIFEHLSQYQEELETRQDKGMFWWELRSCDYYHFFEQPKIVYPDISKESRFTLDTQGIYFGNTVYFIATSNLYLLGILNSSIVWFYCKENLTVLGDADKGGRLRFFRQFVEKIPIPGAGEEQKQAIESLVEKCLGAGGQNCEQWEKEIDQIVYQLYGLTGAEISLIEKS